MLGLRSFPGLVKNRHPYSDVPHKMAIIVIIVGIIITLFVCLFVCLLLGINVFLLQCLPLISL
jgi:hypothetical protein